MGEIIKRKIKAIMIYKVGIESNKGRRFLHNYTSKEQAVKMVLLIKRGQYLPAFRFSDENNITAIILRDDIIIYRKNITLNGLKKYFKLKIEHGKET